MGFLSFFVKKKPTEVYELLAQKIVTSADDFRDQFDILDNKTSVDVGAEMIYFLLHLLDMTAFEKLGNEGRNQVFDNVLLFILDDYLNTMARIDAEQIKNEMIKEMNARQIIYSQCDSLGGNPWPSRGSMIFAFSFYIYRSLGNTKRDDVDEILIGNQDLVDEDMEDFQSIAHNLENMSLVSLILEDINMPKLLGYLK